MKTYVPNQSGCLILKCFGYSGYSGYSTCFTKLPYEPWDIYWSNAKKSLSLHRIQLHVQTTYRQRTAYVTLRSVAVFTTINTCILPPVLEVLPTMIINCSQIWHKNSPFYNISSRIALIKKLQKSVN